MIDPRDRLLEHALHEEVGGDGADAPDLAPAVRAAWERTVEQRPDEGLQRRAQRRPIERKGARPWWIPASAAAALVVVGGGAWWATRSPRDPGGAPAEELAHGDLGSGVPAMRTETDPEAPSTGEQEHLPNSVPEQAAEKMSPAMVERAGFVREALAQLRNPDLAPGTLREMLGTYYREGPFAQLRGAPEMWPLVAPDVEPLLQPGTLASYARTELIDALVLDPSADAQRLVRAAWLVDPEAFSIDAIVVMAERGAFEFEREATAWLGLLESDVPGDPFALALYGALRGDGRGAAILEAELAGDSKEPERPLLAAVCLAKLGEGTAWVDTWDSYKSKLRELLDGPELSAEELGEVASAIDALAYAWTLHDGDVLFDSAPSDEWDGVPHAGKFRHWVDLYYASQASRERTRDSLAEELAALEER